MAWKRNDVDFEHGKLRVRHTLQRADNGITRSDPKTKESNRVISLPATPIAALKTHRLHQKEERLQAGTAWKGNEWNLIFVSDRGTALEPRNVNRQMAALLG